MRTFLLRQGPNILLAMAALFFAGHYMPAFFRIDSSSDVVLPAGFYDDVVRQGHPASAWYWCGMSFLFPGLITFFGVDALVNNDLLSLEICPALYFVAWFGLLYAIYRAADGRKRSLFLALDLFWCVALASWWGTIFHLLSTYFPNCSHAEGMLDLLAGFAVGLLYWRTGRRWALAGLGVVTLLGAASDALLIVDFTIPLLMALIGAAFLLPENRKRAALMAAVISLATALGYLGIGLVFPPQLNTGLYTHPRPEVIVHCVGVVVQGMKDDGFFAFLVIFAGSIWTAGVVWLASHVIKDRGRSLGAVLLLGGFYAVAMFPLNWVAAMSTGIFMDMGGIRYLAPAMALPFVVLVFAACEWLPWTSTGQRLFTCATAALAVVIGMNPPKEGGWLNRAHALQPVLTELRLKDGVTAGLAEYWYAKSMVTLTDGKVPIRQITPQGRISRWLDCETWFSGTGPATRPQFRFILIRDLDAQALRQRFGEPARIVANAAVGDIWVYAPQDVITYDPDARELGNRHTWAPQNFTGTAASLPAQTGKAEGDARVVREGVDREECLSYGPYLPVQPGSYQVQVQYAYTKPPAKGREVSYDSIVWKGDQPISLAQGLVPMQGPAVSSVSWNVAVPAQVGRDGRLEARLFYHGSGDFRFDSLKITYLGK